MSRGNWQTQVSTVCAAAHLTASYQLMVCFYDYEYVTNSISRRLNVNREVNSTRCY